MDTAERAALLQDERERGSQRERARERERVPAGNN